MGSNSWPDRFHALDVSRCVASLSVILWHWQHFAYEGHSLSDEFVRNDQPLFNILELFYIKGAAGVSYFFILSGFIFFWLYKNQSNQNKPVQQNFSSSAFQGYIRFTLLL